MSCSTLQTCIDNLDVYGAFRSYNKIKKENVFTVFGTIFTGKAIEFILNILKPTSDTLQAYFDAYNNMKRLFGINYSFDTFQMYVIPKLFDGRFEENSVYDNAILQCDWVKILKSKVIYRLHERIVGGREIYEMIKVMLSNQELFGNFLSYCRENTNSRMSNEDFSKMLDVVEIVHEYLIDE